MALTFAHPQWSGAPLAHLAILDGEPVGHVLTTDEPSLAQIWLKPEVRSTGLSVQLIDHVMRSSDHPGRQCIVTNLVPAWVAVWYMTHGYPIKPGPYMDPDPVRDAANDAQAAVDFEDIVAAWRRG